MLRAGYKDGGHQMTKSLKEIAILVSRENGHHDLVNILEICGQFLNSRVLSYTAGGEEHVVGL